MTGYFAAAEPAALYYFAEHHRYNPRADHTLLIGPSTTRPCSAAPSDWIRRLRSRARPRPGFARAGYRWLDHALKGAAAPAQLSDRVDFEVIGATVAARTVPAGHGRLVAEVLPRRRRSRRAPVGRRLIRRGAEARAVDQTVIVFDEIGAMPDGCSTAPPIFITPESRQP